VEAAPGATLASLAFAELRPSAESRGNRPGYAREYAAQAEPMMYAADNGTAARLTRESPQLTGPAMSFPRISIRYRHHCLVLSRESVSVRWSCSKIQNGRGSSAWRTSEIHAIASNAIRFDQVVITAGDYLLIIVADQQIPRSDNGAVELARGVRAFRSAAKPSRVFRFASRKIPSRPWPRTTARVPITQFIRTARSRTQFHLTPEQPRFPRARLLSRAFYE